jgi:chromosome partitioning protein
MRNTIAIMNTKGGVGKSTLVLALAETLAAHHGKNVLVIDSDAQASVSSMLMTIANLHKLQSEGRTLVDLLIASVLKDQKVDWTSFVVGSVSDVEESRSLYLMPSDMQLTLFEREVSKGDRHARLRNAVSGLLASVRRVFDVVLIDCPPGLSVLTETWLREADFYVSPTKADYVSICGLDVFRRFKALNPEMGFAENLGTVVNMLDPHADTDQNYRQWLEENPENRCFPEAVPRLAQLQHAVHFRTDGRTYVAKYPGAGGKVMRALVSEMLTRLAVPRPLTAPPPLPPPMPQARPVTRPVPEPAMAPGHAAMTAPPPAPVPGASPRSTKLH